MASVNCNPMGHGDIAYTTRKYVEPVGDVLRGFDTPAWRGELYSETILEHGYEPLPDYEEPLVGPAARPDMAERFPRILTSAKRPL